MKDDECKRCNEMSDEIARLRAELADAIDAARTCFDCIDDNERCGGLIAKWDWLIVRGGKK